MKRKRASRYPGGFTILPKRITETPAWRAMSPGSRLLWIELRGWLRNNGANNGKVFLTCRDAAKAIGTKSKSSIVRWYAENEHYGFLVKTAHGFLGSNGHGIGDQYRFTDLAHGTHPPTRDFEKWGGEMFVYTPRRRGYKKQSPVPTMGTRRSHHGDIQTTSARGSVCTHHGDIDEPLQRSHHGDISRLPAGSVAKKQGSSTARAPTQVGDAGSNPAPVATTTTTEKEVS